MTQDVLRNTEDWFKKALPDPTDKDLSTQYSVFLEEVMETLDSAHMFSAVYGVEENAELVIARLKNDFKFLIELLRSGRMTLVVEDPQKMLSIRQMFKRKSDPDSRPTRSGIVVPLDQAQKLIDSLSSTLRNFKVKKVKIVIDKSSKKEVAVKVKSKKKVETAGKSKTKLKSKTPVKSKKGKKE